MTRDSDLKVLERGELQRLVDAYAEGLGEQIPALRKQLGLTQSTLAELLGVSETTIFRLEAGETRPRFDSLVALLLLGLDAPTRPVEDDGDSLWDALLPGGDE